MGKKAVEVLEVIYGKNRIWKDTGIWKRQRR